MIYRFHDFQLDDGRYQLSRGGSPVRVELRALEVLSCLIRAGGSVTSKEDILEEVWRGRDIGESALSRAICLLRGALGDSAEQPRFIETVYARGYRFLPEVTEIVGFPGDEDPATTPGEAPASDFEKLGEVFVGRERELGEFEDALRGCLQGRGEVVLIAGDPGIGKTRLCEKFAEIAQGRGALILTGGSSGAAGAPPYWPWVKVLRSYLSLRGSDRLATDLAHGGAVIAQAIPELEEHLPNLVPPPKLDALSARFRLFDELARFFTRLARRQPLLLVLEDLHAADPSSLGVLECLARRIQRSKILVIGTHRDAAIGAGHPLTHTRAVLTRVGFGRRIQLGGLSLAAVAQFVALGLGRPPTEAWAQLLLRRSEGNPLFVKEMIRWLARRGSLWTDPDVTRQPPTPPAIEEIICARLDVVARDCRHLLSIASVIGNEFPVGLLRKITGLDAEKLAALLEEARAAALLAASGPKPEIHRFSHGLIREVLYGRMSPSRRRTLHLQVARALEALEERGVETRLERLAHHYLHAPSSADGGKVVAYGLRAAKRAARLLAYEDAARAYERLLEAASFSEGAQPRRRCEVLLHLVEAHANAGNYGQARRWVLEAHRLVRSLGAPELLARTALAYAGVTPLLFQSDPLGAALLRDAISQLPRADSALRAQLLSRLAGAETFRMSLCERAQLANEAVAMARRLGDKATLACVLSLAVNALDSPELIEKAVAMSSEVIELAQQIGDKRRLLEAHRSRLADQLTLGDLESVDHDLEMLSRLGSELGQPRWLTWSAAARVMRAALAGRFAEADEIARDRLERLPPDADVSPIAVACLGPILREREQAQEVLRFAAPLVDSYPFARAVFSALLCDLGMFSTARIHLARLASRGFEDVPRDFAWLASTALLLEASAALGNRDHTGRLYTLLLPFAERNASFGGIAFFGPVSFFLGLGATRLALWQDAESHFRRSLERSRAMNALPMHAHTECAYAGMLFERGHGEARARRLAGSALRKARALEMPRLMRLAAGVLERRSLLPCATLDAAGALASSGKKASAAAAGERPRAGPRKAARREKFRDLGLT